MNTITVLFLLSCCVVLVVGGKATRQEDIDEILKEASAFREKFDKEVVLPAKIAAENGIVNDEEEQTRLKGLPSIPQLHQADSMLLLQTFNQLKEDMETLDTLTSALKKQKPGKAKIFQNKFQ